MSYMNFPFPVDPQLTAITLAYTNRRLIADLVSPRTPVPAREFEWLQLNKEQMFTVPDSRVGRKGEPNEVEFKGTLSAGMVEDYGLDDVVPQVDIDNARRLPGQNPIGLAVQGLTELMLLGREQRVANQYFSLNSYASTNRTTLSGTSQWSDYTNSDPYTAYMTARDSMLVPPNVGIIGRLAFSKLRVHPKITAAVVPSSTGNTSTSNAQGAPVSAQQIADLFELDVLHVGEAFINSSKPGQTPTLVRCWGKHFAAIHSNPIASIRGNAITFGFTAEYFSRFSTQIPEPKVGLLGAQRVRVGESLRELVVANDAGYLFRDVVA